jgi:hypothetical protein
MNLWMFVLATSSYLLWMNTTTNGIQVNLNSYKLYFYMGHFLLSITYTWDTSFLYVKIASHILI